jgi:hypothetical protein
MAGKRSDLTKRLRKMEQQVDQVAKLSEPKKCNCETSKTITVAAVARLEDFEAEMNHPCPAHGFRDLGNVMHVVIVGNDASLGEIAAAAKLEQLVTAYESRRARYRANLNIR